MLIHLDNFIPGLPPLSIITVVAIAFIAANMLLYLLSRVREFFVLSIVAALYGAAPLLEMMKH